jgi:hypothetical protein
MSIDNKILLYKTVLRPILLYASPVWGSAAETHIRKLQIVQNKTLRIIHKAPWYLTNHFIHRDLGIESIKSHVSDLSFRFYNNMYFTLNEELFNLPDYDPLIFNRRPRASSLLSAAF